MVDADADLPEELTPWRHPWVASSRWLRDMFPALSVRSRRLLAALGEQILPSAPRARHYRDSLKQPEVRPK